MYRLSGVALVLLAAACASPPAEPYVSQNIRDRLIGSWNCGSESGGGGIQKTYMADGTGTMRVDLNLLTNARYRDYFGHIYFGVGGAHLNAMAGNGTFAWQLIEGDQKLEEKTTSFVVTKMEDNGKPLDASLVASAGDLFAPQLGTSDVEMTPGGLRLVAYDGRVTSCERT